MCEENTAYRVSAICTRHIGLEADLHQAADHGLGNEIMAIDAAVDHEGRADHGVITGAPGETLGAQRDFEGARAGQNRC